MFPEPHPENWIGDPVGLWDRSHSGILHGMGQDCFWEPDVSCALPLQKVLPTHSTDAQNFALVLQGTCAVWVLSSSGNYFPSAPPSLVINSSKCFKPCPRALTCSGLGLSLHFQSKRGDSSFNKDPGFYSRSSIPGLTSRILVPTSKTAQRVKRHSAFSAFSAFFEGKPWAGEMAQWVGC